MKWNEMMKMFINNSLNFFDVFTVPVIIFREKTVLSMGIKIVIPG